MNISFQKKIIVLDKAFETWAGKICVFSTQGKLYLKNVRVVLSGSALPSLPAKARA